LAVVAVAALVVWRVSSVWWRSRGKRVVTCPDNNNSAGVSVDSVHAAITGLARLPELRLETCTRWPEKAGCGQACLSEIRSAGSACLVQTVVADWYRGRACAICTEPIGKLDWVSAPPAVSVAGGESVEWSAIPADKLHETLAAALPVCFACHTAMRMVKEHPDMVIDRHRAGI
jgi:hypothetical protein